MLEVFLQVEKQNRKVAAAGDREQPVALKSDSVCMLQRAGIIRLLRRVSSLAGASRVIVHRLASLFTTAFGNKHTVCG